MLDFRNPIRNQKSFGSRFSVSLPCVSSPLFTVRADDGEETTGEAACARREEEGGGKSERGVAWKGRGSDEGVSALMPVSLLDMLLIPRQEYQQYLTGNVTECQVGKCQWGRTGG